MVEKQSFYLKGITLGGCSCDWGCPCNFEVSPSRGFCEGEYVWCVEEGYYGDTLLGGLRLGLFLHSPAAIHLGNLTTVAIVDHGASEQQRQATEAMVAGVPPFNVFMELTSNFFGFSLRAY